MARLKTCEVGDVVAIEFDDHSEGEQHIVFEVFGVVFQKNRRSILIGSFVYPESREIDENVVVYTILRAAIRRIDILRAKKLVVPVEQEGL